MGDCPEELALDLRARTGQRDSPREVKTPLRSFSEMIPSLSSSMSCEHEARQPARCEPLSAARTTHGERLLEDLDLTRVEYAVGGLGRLARMAVGGARGLFDRRSLAGVPVREEA